MKKKIQILPLALAAFALSACSLPPVDKPLLGKKEPLPVSSPPEEEKQENALTPEEEQRLARLEQETAELVREIREITPALKELTGIEQPEPTPARNPVSPTTPSKPLPAVHRTLKKTESAPDKPVTLVAPEKRPVTPPEKAEVIRFRLGHHNGKTRIVLDANKKTPYKADLDPGENILIVELPEAGWSERKKWISQDSPLVASYAVQPLGERGSMLVIQLKKGARINNLSAIQPNGRIDYRIVLDLVS